MENLNSYTKILLTEGLTNIIFESIHLDRKFKVNNEKGIKNSVRFLIEKMVDEGLINKENLEKTNAMSSLYNEACKYAEEALDEDIELVLSKFNEDEEVTEVSGDVSEFVKDKVVDVINKEKQIAEQNKEDEEEIDEKTEGEESEGNDSEDSEENETVKESFISAGYHKVESDKPTLFRSIAINAGREPVSEGVDQNLEISNTISESIIQYTILETLHTTKLLEFSARDAQELSFKYYFNPKE
jgi:hypothetical protein